MYYAINHLRMIYSVVTTEPHVKGDPVRATFHQVYPTEYSKPTGHH